MSHKGTAYARRQDGKGDQDGLYTEHTLETQLRMLREAFRINFKDFIPTIPRMESEGLFVIPHWSTVGSKYAEAVQAALDALSGVITKKGRFSVSILNFDPDRLEEMASKHAHLERLRKKQGTDTLLISGQLGNHYVGHTAAQVSAALGPQGFHFGVFEGACLLISHPDRLGNPRSLALDLAGDRYFLNSDRVFKPGISFRRIPYYRRDSKNVMRLSIRNADEGTYDRGCATGVGLKS